ncbi:acyl-CoA dehydrogenase family protein [Pseudonocardia sp.]|uniref:acyl-CoA dehydrogenase family protein n=1 Tax=Pseudonocardia sp. TaxID=60912 RepID=UPI003D0C062B
MIGNDARDDLRREVRRFLERRSAEADVRRLMDDATGYDRDVWSVMADQLGLQGMAIAQAHGGAGFGYEELCVVFEEMGRALLPSPFFATVALAANVLRHSGDEAACARHLPAIARGELVATLALGEEEGGWDDTAVRMRAEPAGSGWTLTGVKRFVLAGHVADLLLVVAHTADGLSLFEVGARGPGCVVEVETTLDLTRPLSRVVLDRAPAVLVGRSGHAWAGVRRALRLAAVALAAEQVGGAQRVLEMTVGYAKVRHQFGRPIGSFQAVKHQLADMLVAVESARSAAQEAARAVAADDPGLEVAASVAKAVCSDTYTRAAATAIQLHGGVGFTWEHPVHLYFKRARSSEFLLGTPGHHRDLVGRAIGV